MGKVANKGKSINRKKKVWDQYDYENIYDKSFDELTGEFIGAVVKPPKGISYTTKTIKAGNQFEVEIYPAFKCSRDLPEGIICKKEKKDTRQAQKNLNDRNSRKRLTRLVHANFGPGDYWCTLTFNEEELPKGLEDAERLSKNFFKRINRLRKKKGLENAKYIYVIEEGTYGTERFHLHMIMDNGLSKDEVEEKWGHGAVTIKTINYYKDENLLGLCNYIVKDPETYKKTAFRIKGKRQWGSSKGNLKEPQERVNRSKFSKKRVMDMVLHQDGIGEMLEKTYPGYQFKEVEIRYNDFNGLFYVYARMQDKRRVRDRR